MSDRLLVLAPLRLEALALARRDGVRILRSGMGPARAKAAALSALRLEADAVAVAGLCAGIAPGLRAGDVVCASELRCDDAPPRMLGGSELVAAALSRSGLRVHVGPLVSSTRIEGPSQRRSRRGEALGLDMESAWLAGAAGGRPLAVVRVVVDAHGRRLADPRIAPAALRALVSLRLAGGALWEWAQALGVAPGVAERPDGGDALAFGEPRTVAQR